MFVVLPDFDDNGNLPPGTHKCNLEVIVARFGQGSPERVLETSELVGFVSWARQAGISRLLVDGSYVTSKLAPVDVDIVILPGTGYPYVGGSAGNFADQWPFLHVMVAADEADLEQWAQVDFGIDRSGNRRGIVEVEL
jgi:hypothetical protein